MRKETAQNTGPLGYDLTLKVLAESKSPRAMDTLFGALTESSPHTQERIFDILNGSFRQKAAPRIISQYNRLSPSARARVLDATESLSPYMRKAMSSDSGEGKSSALSLLGDSRRASLLPLAVNLLKGFDERYRRRAAEEILHGTQRLVRVIKKFGADTTADLPPGVAKAAKAALSAITEALRTYPHHKRMEALESALKFGGGALDLLLEMFSGQSQDTANAITKMLLENPGPETDAFIAKTLLSEDPGAAKKGSYIFRHREGESEGRVIHEALKCSDSHSLAQLEKNCGRGVWWSKCAQHIQMFGQAVQDNLLSWIDGRVVPDEDAKKMLLALLSSKFPKIRHRTLSVVQKNFPETSDQFSKLLDDSDEQIQMHATSEIIKTNAPNREEHIVRQLISKFSSVRDVAVSEVARFSFGSYLQAFEKLDARSRALAANAISKLDPDITKKLRGALASGDDTIRAKALKMSSLTGKTVELEREIIRMVEGDPSPAVRVAAITALPSVDTEAARTAARKCLDDLDRRIVASALLSLGKMRCLDVLDEIMQLRTHSSSRIRSHVIYYLHAIEDERWHDELMRLASDPVAKMRISAIIALDYIHPPDADDILRNLALRDNNPKVRATARKVIETYGASLAENPAPQDEEAGQ